jgi:pimeloyl-ACP methyl ester carboxylesterase
MKLNIFVFIFSLFTIQPVFAVADSSTLCRNYKGPHLEAEVCLSIPNDWDKKDVVYYLHGLGGNAKIWDTDPYLQQAMRVMKQQSLHRPLVVSVSFGPWWVLKDFGNEEHPSLLNAYLQIQKETEAELFKNRQPVRRILMGNSMGGFNSLLLLAKSNLQFDRAAILCPGFAKIGPYSSQEDVQSYLERNKPWVDVNLITRTLGMLKMEFPTQELWQTHAPFSIVGNLKTRIGTKFYVMGNTQDEYGFGEGANLLQNELIQMNLQVAYEVVPGKHCVMNPATLANFLK